MRSAKIQRGQINIHGRNPSYYAWGGEESSEGHYWNANTESVVNSNLHSYPL